MLKNIIKILIKIQIFNLISAMDSQINPNQASSSSEINLKVVLQMPNYKIKQENVFELYNKLFNIIECFLEANGKYPNYMRVCYINLDTNENKNCLNFLYEN
ncbi:hypothetical protein ACQ4LE_006703, partial [Meloidogyne hapla]